MRRRRRPYYMDPDENYARSLHPLHGLKRNTVKSAYHAGWKREVDGYSGSGIHTLLGRRRGFRAIGVDTRIGKFHGRHSIVNKRFRKIEP